MANALKSSKPLGSVGLKTDAGIRRYITWWSCLSIVIIVTAGIVLPIIVYNESLSIEQDTLSYRFDEIAGAELSNILGVMTQTIHAIQNMRIPLQLAGENLANAQYLDAAELLARPTSLATLVWNPLVRNENRDAFEQRIRALNNGSADYANFAIVESVTNISVLTPEQVLTLRKASVRPTYLPYTYSWVTPTILFNKTNRIGNDLFTTAAFGNLSESFYTGEPLINTKVTNPFDPRKKGLYISTPVFTSVKTPNTVSERLASAVGILTATMGMAAIVTEARAYNKSMHMYLFDESKRQILYADAGLPEVASAADISSVEGARFERTLAIANRNFVVVGIPTDRLVDETLSVGPRVFSTVTAVAFFLLLVAAAFAIRKIVRTEEEMAVSEKRRHLVNQMIGYVNHEIRNPLNGIVGLVDHATETTRDCLRASTPDKESIRAIAVDLKDTNNMCELMRHIIDDILDIRCLDEGRLKIITGPISLGRLLNDAVAIIQMKLTEKPSLSLSVEAFDMGAVIVCDAVRVKQLLLNFLINSIKYSECGPIDVRVGVVSGGERLRFSVQDCGKGIEESQRGLVFKPFMQLNGAARHQGVGLGLYLCSMLAEAMSGSIGFESTYGVGSTFWFEIPYVLGSRDEVSGSPSVSSGSQDGRTVVVEVVDDLPSSVIREMPNCVSALGIKLDEPIEMHEIPSQTVAMAGVDQVRSTVETLPALRHLVCDDGRINRVVLKRYIQGHSADAIVDEAENGHAAVLLASERGYDFIWMDIKMPILNGIEATEQIRRLARHIRTPIIGVTGDVTAEEVSHYREVGMQEVLSKPVAKKTIADIVGTFRKVADISFSLNVAN